MHLVATLAGGVALQPAEIAAGVHVQEVRLGRVPNIHGDMIMPAETAQKISEQTNPERTDEKINRGCKQKTVQWIPIFRTKSK